MKRSVYLLIVFLVVVFTSSCKDPLQLKPKSKLTTVSVWESASTVKAVLNNIYRGMGHGANQAQMGSMDDDGSSIPDLGTGVVVQSTVTPDNMGNLSSSRSDQFKWGPLYKYIRQVNVFLKKVRNAKIDPTLKKHFIGEAHFLRAYFYQNLMKAYGGVPIITKVYGINDKNMQPPRNSFKETVNFIISEADSAASMLPTVRTGDNIGRASAGAALALKSRVLLFAASKLYRVNPSGKAFTGYTKSQDPTTLWKKARNAAKAVMDLGVYNLYKANPAPGDSVAKNFHDLFHTQQTNESIMERDFTGSNRDQSQNYRPWQYHGPNGFHQWGGTTPTQNLVDAFKMKDGSDFSWNNPQEAAHPYKNRDPRFYATILYDGAPFRKRPSDDIQYDQDGVIQTFKKLTLPDGETVPGLDTRESPIEPWNGTYSGYYNRKLISADQVPHTGFYPGLWFYFRYGEILLNYAEASIHLGDYAAARNAIDKIRHRAGMPKLKSSLTGSKLMSAYRNERRVEMAFEEHRFWDIRRWMIAPKVMNQDAEGIDISANATNRADRSTYYNYNYKVMTYQKRKWRDKMYFYPIPQSEMNKDPKLKQNPGY